MSVFDNEVKCEYCGRMFRCILEQCPYCGGINGNIVRTAVNQPQTIAELEAWYKSKGLPSYEVTRFFIGVDYKEPRAFGIFKDEISGEVEVYKNTSSGKRAVHYRGDDETYAVNELFQRLQSEIIQQKMLNAKKTENHTKEDES